MADASRGYVYVICWMRSGPVKIGWSTAPKARLSGLQTSIPYTLSLHGAVRVRHPKALEAKMHTLFAPDIMRGEWYSVTPSHAWYMLKRAAAAHDPEWSTWNLAKPVKPKNTVNQSRERNAIDEYNRLRDM